MPAPPDWEGSSPLLSGLFGVLQAGAQERRTTAEVWQGLRLAAGTWRYQASGETEPRSQAEIEAAGRQVLAEQGIGIQEVNTYRKLAGQWLHAKQRLHEMDTDVQVTSPGVWVPPWAVTQGAELGSRYRIRVQWHVTPAEGEEFDRWATYDLDAPITTIDDLLDQANQHATDDRYLVLLSAASPLTISDFELEQV